MQMLELEPLSSLLLFAVAYTGFCIHSYILSVCLNTMRNNKQLTVKCLDIGQTFALKM